MPTFHRNPLVLAVLALSACSADGAKFDASAGSTSETWTDTADGAYDPDLGAGTTSGTFDAPPPVWFVLDGDVQLGPEGPNFGALAIETFDIDEQSACAASWSVDTVEALALPDDEPLFTWWALDLGLDTTLDGDCSSLPDTLSLTLGVGHYDARLDAAAASQGHQAPAPYALYVGGATGTVWLAGAVAPSTWWDGTQSLEVAAQLEPGVYRFGSFFLLPWVP